MDNILHAMILLFLGALFALGVEPHAEGFGVAGAAMCYVAGGFASLQAMGSAIAELAYQE